MADITPVRVHNEFGLLWMREADLDTLHGGNTGRQLRQRFRDLPKVGFLREPYVRTDRTGALLLSLQALCVLAANSTSDASVSIEKMAFESFDAIFQWGYDMILKFEAYHPCPLPPKPWRPFGPIERGQNAIGE
jgi:hypothetical protein